MQTNSPEEVAAKIREQLDEYYSIEDKTLDAILDHHVDGHLPNGAGQI